MRDRSDPGPATRFPASRRGSAAIEFAAVVPIMILLAAGIVECGAVFQVYNQTNRLATQYAIVWSDCRDDTTSCQTELNTYTPDAAKGNVAPQLSPSRITLQMFQVRMSGTTPQVVYAYPAGATPTAAQIDAVQKTVPDRQTGVIVTATYRHSLMFFSALAAPFLDAAALAPSYTVTQLKT
ncbi:hypothetical protein ASG40_14240 [Methylobacterium sp. Leaf399]|uniref:TadE/TadG family type IV pilus assembly protein n=1 Tax=Methylobacterium sp. Leaf399 TaxID=1736364 RepID=UPI0006F9A644|nr:TadE family protein [Methylobacterium sp. Leaf399]KQT07480.1 hypothetical protein ASG40_14240 [Methylobacterium sp. Leaf399]